MFATDYLRVGQQTPIIDYLKNAPLSKGAFERISQKNAEKVFQL